MTVRIIHQPGIGEWPYGAVVQLEDRRARRLLLVGYVEEVKAESKKKAKEKE